MTDPTLPDPDPTSGPVAGPASPPPERVRVEDAGQRRRPDLLPWFYVLGFLILAGAVAYLYQNPSVPSGIQQEAVRVDTLQQQVQRLNDRLGQVEARPAAVPVDLAPLNREVAALQARPVPAASNLGPLEARIAAVEARPVPPSPNLAPLESRIAVLEGRPAPPQVNLAPIEGRITALEGRPPPPPVDLTPLDKRIAAVEARPIPPPVDLAPLNGRVDTLTGKVDTLGGQANTLAGKLDALGGQANTLAGKVDALGGRADALEPRVAAVEQQDKQIAGQLGTVAERSQRISRVQAAMAALDAGQRLGDIPGVPPAVARYAQDAPPTEQALRGSFDKAADAAQHAEQPALTDNQSFGSRLWTRAQQAVTVRQGDNVVVGDPLAGVLGRARQLLDAGDLAGAVAAVDTLTGPPAAAMADWAGQAHGLLDARKALSGLAAHS